LRNINLEIEAAGKTSHMKETTTKNQNIPISYKLVQGFWQLSTLFKACGIAQ
jgi:hypothetical protein